MVLDLRSSNKEINNAYVKRNKIQIVYSGEESWIVPLLLGVCSMQTIWQ